MKINIIGVPIFYGADVKGPEFGPKKLREKGIVNTLIKYDHKVNDFGDVFVPIMSDAEKFSNHSKMKYLKPIVDVNNNLANEVARSISEGGFPLIIGGDHSIGLGSISGVSRAYKNLAVIWMDAHGDINTDETSESGNIHGMSLGSAMGMGHEELVNVYYNGKKIDVDNVYILGARDLDYGEKIIIGEKNIHVYSSEKLKEDGVETIINEVLEDIRRKGIDAIHLSFDLDFIDSSFVPGTGTPVGDGMSIEDTKIMLERIAQTKLVKSMDFVELNTLLDKDDVTADLAIDLLDLFFRNIK